MYRVSVFGLGYIGLVFAVCLAHRGINVIGFDVDSEKLNVLRSGRSPFYEPGLDDLLSNVIKSGRFKVTDDPEYAVSNSEISIIFVGTPSLPDGSCDISYIKAACKMIGEALAKKDGYHLVVVRSTVPPGTCDNIVRPVIEKVSGKICGSDFGLCMNPEFTREGSAISDTFNPSRIVIGEFDKKSGDVLENLYKIFHENNMPPLLRTSLVNAELIKYASNAFLALKISFINLIARLCEKLPNADVKVVARGIGLDPRIGDQFLSAGLGFGGSCFPKDLKALIRTFEIYGEECNLLKNILDINDGQIDRVIRISRELLGVDTLRGRDICVLGLSFKANTDDIRESQAIKLVRKLVEEGARIKVHDPAAIARARRELRDSVKYCNSAEECLEDSELAIIATDWKIYSDIDWAHMKNKMRTPCIVDARRILDPLHMKRLGYRFAAIGLSRTS